MSPQQHVTFGGEAAALPSVPAVLTPILLDHTGRDGSTLLMRLLATSPNVAIPGPYPYEKKYFAYLWRWSRLLERRDKSEWWTYIDLTSLTFESMKSLMGPPPWSSDLIHDREDSMSKHMFEAAWSEFSRRATEQVRADRGDPDADVRYYAEKHQDTRLIDLDELPPVLVLVLVRDPRDMYVSFHAFDAKRQSEGRPEFEGARTGAGGVGGGAPRPLHRPGAHPDALDRRGRELRGTSRSSATRTWSRTFRGRRGGSRSGCRSASILTRRRATPSSESCT